MWEATAALPEQIADALDSSALVLKNFRFPDPASVRSVAVVGMGPSGLAGDAVAAVAGALSSVPIWVGKSYDLPGFIGPNTLTFAVSHSGETEETLATVATALEREAPVVVICGGGPLGELATTSGLPHFTITPGLPASRCALGTTTVALFMTLSSLGLVPDVTSSLAGAAEALGRRRDVHLGSSSPADEVARRIGRTIPLIYGSTGPAAVAAYRWKTQVNENAKTPAFFAVQPDLSHNEVAGWGQHGDITRQVLSLVTLRHAAEHPHTARRFELVAQATDEVMADIIEVWAEGEDALSRFYDLALFGDFVSLFMAGREDIDPGPVPAVGEVEAGLR
jgi:glucose/mannose-6-phosphate isomerase